MANGTIPSNLGQLTSIPLFFDGSLVTIPQGQELFVPFILAVQPNTIVTWQNDDTISHTIMTTWDQSNFLNPQAFSLTAAAGQTVSFTFTRPGIYDYFDHAKARWVDADRRVKADARVPHFPLAMEGIIWVQGSIRGLPSAAIACGLTENCS